MVVTFEKAMEVLKQYGVKMTVQRKVIVEALYNNKVTHPTVEDIFSEIKKKYPDLDVVSTATIYNNLNLLKQYGLVKQVYYHNDISRFDINMDVHHHLLCNQCGKLIDFYYPASLNLHEILKNQKFSPEESYIEIRGTCYQCSINTD